jgi:hypothetical protein
MRTTPLEMWKATIFIVDKIKTQKPDLYQKLFEGT